MIRAALVKYGAFVRIAAALARQERGDLYGRIAFFAIILGVFSSLWRAAAEAGLPAATDPKALLWYLAASEWIVLSVPMVHIDIQEGIRRGDVMYQLGRPVSYLGSAFAEGLGLLAVRAPVLGATAFVCAFTLTARMPPPRALLLVVPFGLAAAALIMAMYLVIGLLAFWLDDVSPLYWIWQKLMFVLGGLMLPLELYPALMRRASGFTPFPAVVGGPASLLLQTESVRPGALARDIVLWSAVTVLTLRWIFRRATSALAMNGG